MSRPLIAGRALAFLGIVLVSLNMRAAVAALSPLVALIRVDLDVNPGVLAALGMIPPLCYGIFGVFSGRIARRLGLERTLLIALSAIFLGTFGRAFVHAPLELLGWTALLFAGIGIGNVLLPPLVKKYFPDRIGLLTTLYVTLFAFGNIIPPLFAVPIAEATDWRVSIGIWSITAVVALVPWLLLVRTHRRDGAPAIESEPADPAFRPWRSPTTWAILAMFFCSGFNSYAIFAWLPQFLTEYVGVSAAAAGALLALYASIGFPLGLFIPVLVARFKLARTLAFTALGCYTVGYAGLLWVPRVALGVWVVCAALGTLTFAASLVLINTRTRTHGAATATSSFVQGIGYLCTAAGVLGFGLVHTLSGGWELPLWFLFCCSLVLIPAGIILGKNRFIDEVR